MSEMTATCRRSRYGVVYPCPVGEHLWREVFIAHDLRLANDTAENRAQADTCLKEYQEHVAKCAGGSHDTNKS